MKFVPSVADDLLAPLPGSLTGRALSSLALRNMHELLMKAEGDEPMLVHLRKLLRERRFDGAPKLKVSLFSMPGARAAFAEAFYFSGDARALIRGVHHAAYRLALHAPEYLRDAPSVLSSGELLSLDPLTLLAEGAPIDRSDPTKERKLIPLATSESVHLLSLDREYPNVKAAPEAPIARFREAIRLIGLGGTSELLDLGRFFPVAIPSLSGTAARFGIIGVDVQLKPLALAVALLEALTFEKLRLYLRMRGEAIDERIDPLIRYAIRETFFKRLERMRLPSFETEDFLKTRESLRILRPEIDPAGGGSIAPELRKLIG